MFTHCSKRNGTGIVCCPSKTIASRIRETKLPHSHCITGSTLLGFNTTQTWHFLCLKSNTPHIKQSCIQQYWVQHYFKSSLLQFNNSPFKQIFFGNVIINTTYIQQSHFQQSHIKHWLNPTISLISLLTISYSTPVTFNNLTFNNLNNIKSVFLLYEIFITIVM